MRLNVSLSLVVFLVLVSGATLSKCVFVSEADRARQLRIENHKNHWPKTYTLVFDVDDSSGAASKMRTDLLGPNLSFTTPACSRLRLAAEQSGETYAGHMVRQRMHYGPCRAFSGGRLNNVWNWPWAHGAPRGDLPPNLMGVFGAWQLRCEEKNSRSRCALVQNIKSDGNHLADITTHFTMAVVRGKAMPVWRVWIPRRNNNWFRGMTPKAMKNWEHTLSACIKKRERFRTCLDRARAKFTTRRTKEIWLSMENNQRNLNFTKCVNEGCMVEMPIDMSAKAYAAFVRKQGVSIKLHPLGDLPLQYQVHPAGFHKALEAFSHIDQTERSLEADNKREAL